MTKGKARTLTIVLIVGLVLRLAYGLAIGGDAPVKDAAWYDLMATNIVNYGQYAEVPGQPTAIRGPGYPLFLAGVYAVFGHDPAIARLAQAFVGAATCLLIFLIGRAVFDERTGLIAAAIAAVYPHFIYYSGQLLIETLYTFLIAAVVLATTRLAVRPSFALLAGCGLLFSLTVLTKASFLIVLPLFIGILLFRWGLRRRESYWRAAIILLFFALGHAPWVARNYAALDALVLTETGGGLNLLRASATFELYDRQRYEEEMNTPAQIAGSSMGEIERDRYFRQEAVKFIREHPETMARYAARKFATFWGVYPRAEHAYEISRTILVVVSVATFVPILFFAAIGATASVRLWRQELFLYGVVLSFTLLHMIFWSEGRYRVPIMPYVIVFAAHGISVVVERLQAAARPQSLRP